MAALDFPDSPTVGQIYDKWTWNGSMWVLTGGPSGAIPTQFKRITANTAGVSTGTVISALNITGIVVDGTRLLRVSFGCRNVSGTPGNSGASIQILQNGAAFGECAIRWDAVGAAGGVFVDALTMPVAGTYAYAPYMAPVGVTMTVEASASGPAFLMVEDVT